MILSMLEKVDSISQQFVINGYQEFVNTYTPAIYGLVILCIIVYGYAALQGWVTLSLAETGKRLLTIGFVLSFALNWGIFSNYIFTLFTQVPIEIGDALIKALPTHSYFSDVHGINALLQQTWIDGIGFGIASFKLAGYLNWPPFFGDA